jgi:hypothetical protein
MAATAVHPDAILVVAARREHLTYLTHWPSGRFNQVSVEKSAYDPDA